MTENETALGVDSISEGNPNPHSRSGIKDREIARFCAPFDSKAYENLDLNRLTVYAICLLDRSDLLVTFENIVVALFIMFPKKFGLVGFEQYPDSARVNRALLQLRPKYRNWATGSPSRGYRLTPAGLLIADETAKLLSTRRARKEEARTSKRARTLLPSAELERRILKSSAYAKYSENREEKIDKMEVLELLRAVPHAPLSVLNNYLRELENIAQEAKRPDVLEFLKFVRKRLRDNFNPRGGEIDG
jgi:hypothetical protein